MNKLTRFHTEQSNRLSAFPIYLSSEREFSYHSFGNEIWGLGFLISIILYRERSSLLYRGSHRNCIIHSSSCYTLHPLTLRDGLITDILYSTRLQNTVVNAVYFYFRNASNLCPALQDVQYIYENTQASSKMRALLSECVAVHLHSGRLRQPFPEEWEKTLNSSGALGCDALGCDIIKIIYRWDASLTISRKLDGSPCKFHNHEDGGSCKGLTPR